MNTVRLVGMALAVVGVIVLVIARLLAYQLGLYLGIIVIVVGFVIYLVGVLKIETASKKNSDTSASGFRYSFIHVP
jgi:hypothetical protein